jgi:EAL domain-containing protein (putative c-di-GMP-specific phosphodiesterase class I)
MADTALYHAKDRGKGQFVLFEPSLPRPALRSLSLDADLRMAVQRNELVLHFQPIVTLDTLCIAGFEALIRWRHPRLGLLSPNEFIPMAEESGLIRSLGAWIIEQGCERLSVWQSVHGKPLTLNINLSALQFRQRDILSHLATISDRSGLMPGSLQLEITESVLMQDDGQTLKNLSDLHRLGFGIAIDDFGVGYSSLSYLKRFRVDSLKLDQSFMKDLDDPRSEALVKGTIQLGHSLGVIVVAEGIETREQLELLRKAGCDQGQGYLLGRPMDEFQVMDMLSSGAFLKPWVTEGKGVESDDAVTGKGWQAAVA